MNLKKDKILSSILIIALCFLFHFLYEWFPNPLFAIFFPVNESIWEHMKILFSSICFYGIIDYIILYKHKIGFNNFFFNIFTTGFLSVVVYLLFFIPIYKILVVTMIVSISLMIIVIILSQIISYFILKSKHIHYINSISFILIIISYIVFGYLTYNPIHNYLFLDNIKNIYGIKNYNI